MNDNAGHNPEPSGQETLLRRPSPCPEATLEKSLRVVAIGGGTGLSTLLRGLRKHVLGRGAAPSGVRLISDLAAIVTVTDDGGSSGRLRKDFNMLPPGDLRNCMVALSEEEDLLCQLFSHRFRSGESLEGHNLGNLFVAALTEITGDFGRAIELASKVLSTCGRIYPATLADGASLLARMDDGSLVRGETNITASAHRVTKLMMDPPDAAALPEPIEAIQRADLITVGPGSLYTSLIASLLVRDVCEALIQARGLRVFICNLMTQVNESRGLSAAQHIERIYEHAGQPVFDCALINTRPFSPELLARYGAHNAIPIQADLERIEKLGVRVIAGDFASDENLARHNAPRVAETLLQLALEGLAR